jgi:hypothetical protein
MVPRSAKQQTLCREFRFIDTISSTPYWGSALAAASPDRMDLRSANEQTLYREFRFIDAISSTPYDRTVAALISEPPGTFFLWGKNPRILRLLCFYRNNS